MPRLPTPREIRELWVADAARVSDPQLLTLVLARGSSISRGRARRDPSIKMSWTAVELAEGLYAEAGWQLPELARRALAGELDLAAFGVGPTLGGKLIAALELAERWRRGRAPDGEGVRCENPWELAEQIFRREEKATDAELLRIALGDHFPQKKPERPLLERFGDPWRLLESLTLACFERFGDRPVKWRLVGTRLELETVPCFSLLACAELARRLRAQAELDGVPVDPESFGIRSPELLRLLDPESPIEPALRASLTTRLRSHPELAEDFARLDALMKDAQTSSPQHAVELHRMFEVLMARSEWTSPREILGRQVPYGRLLAISKARRERATEPSAHLQKVRLRLLEAEQRAAENPVNAFVSALLELGISEAGCEWALEEARRAYRSGHSRDLSRQPPSLAVTTSKR